MSTYETLSIMILMINIIVVLLIELIKNSKK